jgi:hypothetical protein
MSDMMELTRRASLSRLFTLLQTRAIRSSFHRPVRVAFNYAARSSLSDLNYFSAFDVLVTGGVLSPDQVRIARQQGTHLVLYVWSSAFYPNEGIDVAGAWQAEGSRNAGEWLLSPDRVGGGAAETGKPAFWYDFGHAGFRQAFADYLCALLRRHGYRGVFLDTLGFAALPAELKQEFQQRHPGKSYDLEQAQLLALLRRRLGTRGIIFTNQGYRKPDLFLPFSDFDLTENSFTSVSPAGETEFRPWYTSPHEWDSIEVPMTHLVLSASRSFPRVQFVHLNYATGSPETLQRAVEYSYACARLWNHSSFVALPGIQRAIRSRIYFTHLGDPVTRTYTEDRGRGVAWRAFQNGLVAINSSDQPYRIEKVGVTLSDPPRGYVLAKLR